jgi:hypothetical protein
MESKQKVYNLNNSKITEYVDKNIVVFEDIITDEFCKELIEFIESNKDQFKEETLGSHYNVECFYLYLEELKKRQELINLSSILEIDQKIFLIIGQIINALHAILMGFKGKEDSGYNLRKIFGGTRLHIDTITTGGYKEYIRCASVIINLNDDYDGGIFNFPKQDFSIKLNKGSAIVFPPYWTHPHEVSKVGEGQSRYTINTWLQEKLNNV